MVAVGIDASLSRTAIASFSPARHHYIVIQTHPSNSLPARLRRISDEVYYALRDWPEPVDLVVMETPGFVQRRGSMEAVYRAQGAVLCGVPTGLRVEVASVSTWRGALGIVMKRGAGKSPIIRYMSDHGITIPMHGNEFDDDVADAFGLSIYGAGRLPSVPAP